MRSAVHAYSGHRAKRLSARTHHRRRSVGSASGKGTCTVSEGMAGLAIVDAHQHFWDPVTNYHPWLRDEPPIPFRYGDYRPIRRRYLPPDYRADASPIRIDQTVYIETEWDPADPVGEMRYVERLRH